jgi:hypothetical protein
VADRRELQAEVADRLELQAGVADWRDVRTEVAVLGWRHEAERMSGHLLDSFRFPCIVVAG